MPSQRQLFLIIKGNSTFVDQDYEDTFFPAISHSVYFCHPLLLSERKKGRKKRNKERWKEEKRRRKRRRGYLNA
jgi:site-specific DNA-adenine methylase